MISGCLAGMTGLGGAVIGDGKESFEIVDEIEAVLSNHNIPLPDWSRVAFSNSSELNGWGNDFDGTFLSIILKQ